MGVIQIILNSLPLIGSYALATFGIVLIFRTSATTNFAQGLIGSAGAYCAAFFSIYLFGNTNFVLAVVIAVVITFLFGMFVDVGIIKRGKNLNPGQKQIVTMGLLMILNAVLPVIFKSNITMDNKAVPYYLPGTLQFANNQLFISYNALIGIGISLVVLALVFLALRYTKWGLSVRATASNEIVGQMMGINTRFVSAISWAISAGLVTLSACSFAGTPVTTSMMGTVQVYGFLACVLGGLTSFFAPMIGVIIIPLLSNILATWTSIWYPAIVFVVVLGLIIIFPNGLFGKKYVKKV